MAEGLVNHFRGDRWEAFSAGTAPAGYVHPLAVKAMDEIGIDISAGYSKPVDGFRDVQFDLVITVCDDAAENCPLWLGSGNVRHMGFPDPAQAPGSKEQRLEVFRQVRNGLRQKVIRALDEMENPEPPGEFHAP
jgi:arsenate reductase